MPQAQGRGSAFRGCSVEDDCCCRSRFGGGFLSERIKKNRQEHQEKETLSTQDFDSSFSVVGLLTDQKLRCKTVSQARTMRAQILAEVAFGFLVADFVKRALPLDDTI